MSCKKHIKLLVLLSFLVVTSCHSQEKASTIAADKKATYAAKNIPGKLKTLSEQGMMIGHQDDLAYGIGWKYPDGKSDVFKVCGDYPAVFGWDLGGIELSSPVNLDSVPFAEMKKHAIDAHSKGGINTFSWHLNNPLTGGTSWDISSKEVVKNILPGGSKNAEFNKWLDRVADFFSDLKDEKGDPIPVIFRPYHELTGEWFWWGKPHCSTSEFVQLWTYTFEYLTETKKLHNLIFAFSTAGSFENTTEFADRYPGDKYVDLVGFDLYQTENQPNADFSKTLRAKLSVLFQFANAHNKPAAITELGYERIPDPEWWTKTFYPAVEGFPVAYTLFWRNAANRPNHYYMPYPGQVSADDFKKFYSLPRTIFLKDMESVNIYK